MFPADPAVSDSPQLASTVQARARPRPCSAARAHSPCKLKKLRMSVPATMETAKGDGAPPRAAPLTLVVLNRFADLVSAVAHAEGIVAEYAALSRAARDALCTERAPQITRGTQHGGFRVRALRSFSDTIVVVFDIDDTVVYSDDDLGDEVAVPIAQVLTLLKRLVRSAAFGHRVRVHFITARLQEPHDLSTRTWTEDQLRAIGAPPHASLHLAPAAARTSRVNIARWKYAMRLQIANEENAPVVLSVGDQVSDIAVIRSDADIDAFDAETRAEETPFAIVRCADGCTLWGLKLRSRD